MIFSHKKRNRSSLKFIIVPAIIAYSVSFFSITGFGEKSPVASSTALSVNESQPEYISPNYLLDLLNKISPVDLHYESLLKDNGEKILIKLQYYKNRFKDKNLNLRSAIIHFQSDNNIKADGVWDNRCVEALMKKLILPGAQPPDKITNIPNEGSLITINKTKNILTLYNGSSPVKKYPVSIGNPPSLTPTGKYKIVNRITNPSWGGGGYAKPIKGGAPNNPLGYRWLGLSLKGGSAYGIHGTTDPYSIGTYASHGCIRMYNFDVEELFTIVNVGIPVFVGTETELRQWGITQDDSK